MNEDKLCYLQGTLLQVLAGGSNPKMHIKIYITFFSNTVWIKSEVYLSKMQRKSESLSFLLSFPFAFQPAAKAEYKCAF